MSVTTSFRIVKGVCSVHTSGANRAEAKPGANQQADDEVLLIPVRGPWSKHEDEKLLKAIDKIGARKWSKVAIEVGGRNAKQCRERWRNHLNPEIKKGEWEDIEDETIAQCYTNHGSKWSAMSFLLEGRTDNAIKNRFNSFHRSRVYRFDAAGSPKKVTNFNKTDSPPPTTHASRTKSHVGNELLCSVDDQCNMLIDEIEAHETGRDSSNFLIEEFQKQLDQDQRLPLPLFGDLPKKTGKRRQALDFDIPLPDDPFSELCLPSISVPTELDDEIMSILDHRVDVTGRKPGLHMVVKQSVRRIATNKKMKVLIGFPFRSKDTAAKIAGVNALVA